MFSSDGKWGNDATTLARILGALERLPIEETEETEDQEEDK